jgi:Poxvirus A32 protein
MHRDRGKTTLLAHLLNVDKTKFAAICVVSGSESFHSIKKINPKHIFNEWNEELMQGIFDEIKYKNAGIAIGKQNKYLLILDDLISESNFTYNTSKCIMKQYCVVRHISYGILTISQHLNKNSKLERSNLSFIFISSMSASYVDLLMALYDQIPRFEYRVIATSADATIYFVPSCNSCRLRTVASACIL